MGVVPNIAHDRWPHQGHYKGRAVTVCFRFDLENQEYGLIIRDDAEEPYETLIQLTDGRVVRASECQYALVT